MPKITAVDGRILFNSRGSKTIEVDVTSDGRHLGRVCAPSGASVGRHEAVGFPKSGPQSSLEILRQNQDKLVGLDSDDLPAIHDIIRSIDATPDYSICGGSLAFALTIASMDSASRALDQPLFVTLRGDGPYSFPLPLGNILGGGAHAGPATPDIQEILVCPTGAKTIRDAIEMNLAVHAELGSMLNKSASFTGGRGDEGGWAPALDNHRALELAAGAIEGLGYTLGEEMSLGVDFASSTQWDARKNTYVYGRAGFENSPDRQIEFVSDIIRKYKLVYAEDAVHEDAFEEMARLASRFPHTLITGDDLTVTNKSILENAIKLQSCNAAILKVNQAGSLHDALEFADHANSNGIRLITSHRSGESTDSHISHIGIATKSRMLKAGVLGGERVAKLNELLRLSEHDLIYGMSEI